LSGDVGDWFYSPGRALSQVAAFKTAVDTIGEDLPRFISSRQILTTMTAKVQGFRPQAYAQEPSCNVLDTRLLGKLGIMKVDSPRGWELVNENSFTFCSYPEPFVAFSHFGEKPGISCQPKD
jgi:hypothetical protein